VGEALLGGLEAELGVGIPGICSGTWSKEWDSLGESSNRLPYSVFPDYWACGGCLALAGLDSLRHSVIMEL